MFISGFQGVLGFDFQRSLLIHAGIEAGPVLPRPRSGPSLSTLARPIVELREAVEDLSVAARTERDRTRKAFHTPASATSTVSLGLGFEPAPARLESIEEVNTTPTSFTPFGPDFAGSSSALATIGGVYDGSQGDDVLTFKVKKAGVVGVDSVHIDVFDGGGNKIDAVKYQPNDPAGTVETLSNGLTLSFSDGDLVKNDTFEVQVFASVGSAVDPDKPFDGTRNDNPNLEPGFAVTAGSLVINGVSIQVFADDSLNDVLDRITASDAGVVASFDAASERVLLEQKTPGPDETIELGTDTSGFFDAVKLTGAALQPGTENDLERPIAEVAALAGISAGVFEVDGFSIAVDPTVDTLQDVLDRINASGAQVVASYDTAGDVVEIRSTVSGDSFELEDGSSGFLGGIEIPDGIYEAETFQQGEGTRTRFAREPELRRGIRELADALEGVFELASAPQAGEIVDRLRSAVSSAFEGRVGSTSSDLLRSGLGIDFDFRAHSGEVLRLDRSRLESAFLRRTEELSEFLLGEVGEADGLVTALEAELQGIASDLANRLDPAASPGLIVNLLA